MRRQRKTDVVPAALICSTALFKTLPRAFPWKKTKFTPTMKGSYCFT